MKMGTFVMYTLKISVSPTPPPSASHLPELVYKQQALVPSLERTKLEIYFRNYLYTVVYL